MKKTNFARSCEINGAIATSVASCIILHGCAKLAYKSSLAYNRFSSSSPFHTVMRNCTIWFLSSFLLLPSFSSFDSTLTTFNWLQIPIQTNYIVFFLIIHIIHPLQFHFSFVTQCIKNHLEIAPKLHKNH